MILRRPRLPTLLAIAVTGLVMVNAMWLQKGRHPAPLFEPIIPQRPLPAPRPDPVAFQIAPSDHDASINSAEDAARRALLRDLQAALSQLGFYDGPVDGLDGPRTHAAVSTYQKAHGLDDTGEASYRLLQHVRLTTKNIAPLPPAPPAGDPQVAGLQKVLADLGYAPGKIDGQLGAETRSAIERFERDRNLPVTGKISADLVKELSQVSGVSLQVPAII